MAVPYASGGMNRYSLYSDAMTVAIKKAVWEWPEGNERFEVERPGPSHLRDESPELGLCLCPENFITSVKALEIIKLSSPSNVVLRARLFFV